MSGWTKETLYRCFNDCRMEGCPGHVMKMEYRGVSDTYTIFIDDKEYLCADEGILGALNLLWREDK